MGSRFKILGRTRLQIAAHDFDDQWGWPKLRGLLAVLLLHAGQPVPVDDLVAWMWPDGKEPENPLSTLDSYAWRTRKALRRLDSPPRIARVDGAYRIDGVTPTDIDFFEFRAAFRRARVTSDRGGHEEAAELLTAALGLWTDRPIADVNGERARNWRLWAENELWLPANDDLLRELTALGRHEEALLRLADLPAEHQTNPSLMKRRLEALYGLGRAQEASSFLMRMRKHLRVNGDQDEADDLLRFHDSLREDNAEPPTTRDDDSITTEVPYLLRHDVPDFIGREDLIRELDGFAPDPTGAPVAGIVVLDGAAGVGKTTLAVHWAHRVASRFPGGVLYADLGGFAPGPKVEPARIVDEFLATLGIPAERIPTTAGRFAKLRGSLTGRQALVLLDNAQDSSHVLPLLDCLSNCLVVVTSRRTLSGLARRGATNLQVPPLSYNECKSWITRRLGDRLNGTPGGGDKLAELCGGNMLALRVVAQHLVTTPHVPVDELVDELRDSHNLLSLGDDGDGPDSSVRAVLSWSYRLLSQGEQRLFRLLGLHPGPDVTLDLAAALVGEDQRVTKRDLDALVNTHLLGQPESRSRYRFHDLVRKYAVEQINATADRAERDDAAERMLNYYLHSTNNADQMIFPYRPGVSMLPVLPGVTPQDFPDDDAAMRWCIRERVNINLVIGFAHDFGLHAYSSRIPAAVGEAFQRLGFYDDCITALHIAIDSARAMGETEEEGDALSNLGLICVNLRDFESAESHLRAAEEKYTTINYEIGLAWVSYNRGRLHVERGDFETAVSCYENSLTRLRRTDVEALEVSVLHRLAEANRRNHNHDTAITYCRDGLYLAERIGDENGQAKCLTELASALYEKSDLASAGGYCARALALQVRQRDRGQAARTCNLLAKIADLQHHHVDAEQYARTALDHGRAARDPREQSTARITLARQFHRQARIDDAIREKSRALAILDDLDPDQAAVARISLDDIADTSPIIPATRTEPLVSRTGSRKPHHK